MLRISTPILLLLTFTLVSLTSAADSSEPGDCPSLLGTYEFGDELLPVTDLTIQREFVFAATADGLSVFRLQRDGRITPVSTLAVGAATHVAVSGSTGYLLLDGVLATIDLSVVTMPRVLGTLEAPVRRWDSSPMKLTRGHIVLHNDVELLIVDVRSPQDPIIRARLPWQGYPGREIALHGTTVYASVDDGSQDGLQRVDISDLDQPRRLPPIQLPFGVAQIRISDDLAVVVPRRKPSLAVLDLSRGARIVATLDNGEYYNIIAFQHGLLMSWIGHQTTILDLSQPQRPRTAARLVMKPWTAAIFNNDLVAFDSLAGLVRLDLSNLTQPGFESPPLRLGGSITDFVAHQGFAFVATGNTGLAVVDLDHLHRRRPVARLDVPVFSLARDPDRDLLVVTTVDTLLVVDIANPYRPRIEGSVQLEPALIDVDLAGSTAFVSSDTRRLYRIEIDQPSRPIVRDRVPCPGFREVLAIDEFRAVTTGGRCHYADLSTPGEPRVVHLPDLLNAWRGFVRDQQVYLTLHDDLVQVDCSGELPEITRTLRFDRELRDPAALGNTIVALQGPSVVTLPLSQFGSLPTGGASDGVLATTTALPEDVWLAVDDRRNTAWAASPNTLAGVDLSCAIAK